MKLGFLKHDEPWTAMSVMEKRHLFINENDSSVVLFIEIGPCSAPSLCGQIHEYLGNETIGSSS